QPELRDHAADVVEGHDGVVDGGGIAVAVAALVEREDAKVRLQRNGQRVPRVGVAGEAVQQEQRGPALAAPVEEVEPEVLHLEMAVDRAQQVHGGPFRIGQPAGAARNARVTRRNSSGRSWCSQWPAPSKPTTRARANSSA